MSLNLLEGYLIAIEYGLMSIEYKTSGCFIELFYTFKWNQNLQQSLVSFKK